MMVSNALISAGFYLAARRGTEPPLEPFAVVEMVIHCARSAIWHIWCCCLFTTPSRPAEVITIERRTKIVDATTRVVIRV